MESQLIEELLGLLQKMNEERGVPEGESLEDKNILQGNSPSNPNKKISPLLNSNERRRTSEIATIFAKSFREYTKKYKKDEKPPTLISQTRGRLSSPPPLPENKRGGAASTLAGLLLLLGGVGALIYGILNDGALKGVMKILSKIGIKGGVKLLMGAAKGFVKIITGFLKKPFQILMKLAKFIFKPIGGMISKLIPAGIKGLGKGLLGGMLKGLKPLLSILKKIPIIGSIISIGFAISRFKSGDNIGGVIDVLSALAGLLNLIPGGSIIAIPLAIGFDLLNAFLDAKTAGAKDKQGAKMNILKEMGGKIGSWFKKNAIYMPIIGGFMRFGKSWDAFQGGNIMDGIKELGLGLITFIGGGPIIAGIEMLMGFFGDKVKDVGNLKSNSSWYNKLGEWIYKKLGNMPYWIRKPLEWFGIIESTSEDPTVWASIKSATSGGMSGIIDFVSNSWGAVKEMAGVGIDFIKEGSAGIIDGVKSMFSKVSEGFKNITKSVGNWIGKFNPFGGGDKSKGGKKGGLSDSQKEARAKAVKSSSNTNEEKAKAAGHSSWEEYKASGWKWKSAGIASVVQEGKPESINHLQEAAKIQIKLLGEISHWGKLSLMELKRMSGNGGGGNVSVNASMTQPQENSLVTLGDNRGGYAASPYALS
jgi:hypothetical protein